MRKESDDPKQWFSKAEVDRSAALILMESNTGVDGVRDMVCYHAQQCAEKYLKGFLKFRDVKFKWVHDLKYLVDLCVGLDAEFGQLTHVAEKLTRAAELSRYPAGEEAATVTETRDALAGLEIIREMVLRKYQ
jgi:HEPN domain-containing protein